MKSYHKKWGDEYLGTGKNIREDKWSCSIAVVSKGFVERVKSILGSISRRRKVKEIGEAYQLREPSIPYGDHFEVKNDDIRSETT